MRIFWSIVIGAVIGGGALAGWHYFKTNGDQTASISDTSLDRLAEFNDRTFFEGMRTEKFTISNGKEADIDALIAALPAYVAVSYGEKSFDQSSGATVLKDVKITAAETPTSGVSIAELFFWDLDVDGLVDRINGNRLDQTYPVLGRVEAIGTSAFGLEKLYQPIIDASNDLATDFIDDNISDPVVANEIATASNTNVEEYEFSIAKMVASNIIAHPFVLDLYAPEQNDGAESNADNEINLTFSAESEDHQIAHDFTALHWFQKIAAFNRAYSIDSIATYDLSGNMKFSDDTGMNASIVMSMPSYGVKDYDRGDTSLIVARDMSFNMEMAVPAPGVQTDGVLEDIPSVPVGFSGIAELYRFSDMKLGKLLGYLARGEMPERTVTDLLSLGLWQTENESWRFDDQNIYSVRKSHVDLTNFHWFIPNKVNVEVDDIKYDIGGILKWVGDMEGAGGQQTMSPEEREVMLKSISILEKYDFAAPNMDWDLSWNWQPETGAFVGDHLFRIDDFLTFTADSDLELQDYDTLMSQVSGDMNEEAFQELVETFFRDFSLNSMSMRLADKGGLDKGFGMAVDFADLFPEAAGASSFLTGADPKDLRVTSATMLRFGAGSVSQAFPQAKDYVSAVADFIAKGGALELKLRPKQPVSAATIEALEQSENPGEEAINLLGLSFKRVSDNGKTVQD